VKEPVSTALNSLLEIINVINFIGRIDQNMEEETL